MWMVIYTQRERERDLWYGCGVFQVSGFFYFLLTTWYIWMLHVWCITICNLPGSSIFLLLRGNGFFTKRSYNCSLIVDIKKRRIWNKGWFSIYVWPPPFYPTRCCRAQDLPPWITSSARTNFNVDQYLEGNIWALFNKVRQPNDENINLKWGEAIGLLLST